MWGPTLKCGISPEVPHWYGGGWQGEISGRDLGGPGIWRGGGGLYLYLTRSAGLPGRCKRGDRNYYLYFLLPSRGDRLRGSTTYM